MQALSEEDRRLWMEAMDGREPVGCYGYRLFLCDMKKRVRETLTDNISIK